MGQLTQWAKAAVIAALLAGAVEALGALREAFADGAVTPVEWKHIGEVWVTAFIGVIIRKPGDRKAE